MPNNAVRLNDQLLLTLYSKFQEQRRSLPEICSQAFYDNFVDEGSYPGGAMLAALTASDQMFEIANSANRFHYDVHSLVAWESILASATEDEQLQALFEFVFPLASYSFSSPYSIKQKFSTSVYEISYHTNRLVEGGGSQGEFKSKPSYKDAEKIAKKFASWPALSVALGALCNDEFSQQSSNYRHRFHHGFPPTIGLGHRMIVQRRSPGSYNIVSEPPLAISDIIHPLVDQYKATLDVYSRYIELIREQEKLWIA